MFFIDEEGAESFIIWDITNKKDIFDDYNKDNIKVNFTGGTDTHILALVHIKDGKNPDKYYIVYCSDGNTNTANGIFDNNKNLIEAIILSNGSNLTDMSFMFFKCTNLKNLNLSKFNTINITDMRSMFSGCSSLTSLDLSNFNTQNVIYMTGMFQACHLLDDIKLSSFNTQNVIYMGYMFSECSSLISLNLSNFNTQNVTDMKYMFSDCNENLKITVGTDTTTKTGLIEQAQEDGYKVYKDGVCSKI